MSKFSSQRSTAARGEHAASAGQQAHAALDDRERELFIGTRFSNPYTASRSRVIRSCSRRRRRHKHASLDGSRKRWDGAIPVRRQ